MKRPVRLLTLLLAPAAANAAAPNLDCASAESSAEKLVCADPALAALDRELARLVAPARDCRQASGGSRVKAPQAPQVRSRAGDVNPKEDRVLAPVQEPFSRQSRYWQRMRHARAGIGRFDGG